MKEICIKNQPPEDELSDRVNRISELSHLYRYGKYMILELDMGFPAVILHKSYSAFLNEEANPLLFFDEGEDLEEFIKILQKAKEEIFNA